MFTGIVETVGKVVRVEEEGSNKHFLISSAISNDLRVDQSVSHSGVCLTVTKLEPGAHWVTAIKETLLKSSLSSLSTGSEVNLERSMLNNGRFDGHIVQGHVDLTGVVTGIREEQGSWIIDVQYDSGAGNITVEKGSICMDGISLTCFNSRQDAFSVAIIPFTFTHTTINTLRKGQKVNLEFDIVGKYIRRILQKD
ncbi:MAG: riboflavin synthase [Cyclobacteriaceae bacterium]|nr:riboflavin synthase [Cyclobacteriaceae bacterium]